MTATGAAVSVRGLTKRFGRVAALDSVSFDIPKNSVFGLLGPNGAGKTTLFSLVAGFLRPTSGSVQVLDIAVERISELRGRLSILPQDAMFQANVPVLEQMVFFCQLSGYARTEAEAEAMRALEIVGLADSARKNARVLSHGMTKRLGIAQAFLGRPEVILLDEPTAGLDPVNARAIRDLIREFPRTGTLVVSSHDLPEVQEMCTHVAILDRGRLALCGTVASIVDAHRKVRMTFARPLGATEEQAARDTPGVTTMTRGADGTYLIALDGDLAERSPDEIIADIVHRLSAVGVVPRAISEGESLEERFLKVTGDGT